MLHPLAHQCIFSFCFARDGCTDPKARHFNAIGVPAAGAKIVDHDDAGYGPMNVRTLKDNPSMQPKLNADNYRWFAQEVYWSAACKMEFGPPTDNRDQIKCLNQETGQYFFCPL